MFITIIVLGLLIIVSFYYSRKPLPAPTPVVVEPTTSLIGRKYFPTDNSYAHCISDSGIFGKKQDYYLAGTYEEEEIECTIVSEPFYVSMPAYIGKGTRQQLFVIVQDSVHDKTHLVLFNERGLEGRKIKIPYIMDYPSFIY